MTRIVPRLLESPSTFAGGPLEAAVAVILEQQQDKSLLAAETVRRVAKSGIFQQRFPGATGEILRNTFKPYDLRSDPPPEVWKGALGDGQTSVVAAVHTKPNAVVSFSAFTESHHPRMGFLHRQDNVTLVRADDNGDVQIPLDGKTGVNIRIIDGTDLSPVFSGTVSYSLYGRGGDNELGR